MAQPSDHDLMKLVAQGDHLAFADLYDRLAPVVFGLLLKLLRHRARAEDALQQTFLQVWEQSDRYDARLGSPAAWITTMARRRGVDLIRRDKRLSPAELPVQTVEPREHADLEEFQRRVSSAVAGLTPAQKSCLMLAWVHGKTHEEIARLEGLPLGTVKTWIRRGVQLARDAVFPVAAEAES